MSNEEKKFSHSRWNCKYHIVFTPKYRRKVIYGNSRKLYEIKEVEIIEANTMPDDIHMLVKISPKLNTWSFMCYLRLRSAVLITERHANLKCKYGNRTFWVKGYLG